MDNVHFYYEQISQLAYATTTNANQQQQLNIISYCHSHLYDIHPVV